MGTSVSPCGEGVPSLRPLRRLRRCKFVGQGAGRHGTRAAPPQRWAGRDIAGVACSAKYVGTRGCGARSVTLTLDGMECPSVRFSWFTGTKWSTRHAPRGKLRRGTERSTAPYSRRPASERGSYGHAIHEALGGWRERGRQRVRGGECRKR